MKLPSQNISIFLKKSGTSGLAAFSGGAPDFPRAKELNEDVPPIQSYNKLICWENFTKQIYSGSFVNN